MLSPPPSMPVASFISNSCHRLTIRFMLPAGIKKCERGESRCGHQINGQRHVSGIVAKNIASGDQNSNFFPSNQKPQRQLHSVYGFWWPERGMASSARHTGRSAPDREVNIPQFHHYNFKREAANPKSPTIGQHILIRRNI